MPGSELGEYQVVQTGEGGRRCAESGKKAPREPRVVARQVREPQFRPRTVVLSAINNEISGMQLIDSRICRPGFKVAKKGLRLEAWYWWQTAVTGQSRFLGVIGHPILDNLLLLRKKSLACSGALLAGTAGIPAFLVLLAHVALAQSHKLLAPD